MTDFDEQHDPKEPFGDLLGALDQLAGRIDRASFPGRAWPVARRKRRRLIWSAVCGTAAAAAIAVAAVVWSARGAGPTQPPPAPVAKAPAQTPGTNGLPVIFVLENDPCLPGGTRQTAMLSSPSRPGEVDFVFVMAADGQWPRKGPR